ncbi:MAG: hypothetical protein ACPGEF_04425, partial [Endozoicomonas sp.]
CVAVSNKLNGIGLVEGSRVTISRHLQSQIGDPNDLSLVLLFPVSFLCAELFNKESCIAINSDTPLGIALFLEKLIPENQGIADLLMAKLPHCDIENVFNNTDNSLLNLAASCELNTVKKLQKLLGDDIFKELLERQTTPGGSTPFHHCAKTGYPEVFEYLQTLSTCKGYLSSDSGKKTPIDYISKRINNLSDKIKTLEAFSAESMTYDTIEKISFLTKELTQWNKQKDLLDKKTGEQVAQISLNAIHP